MKISKGSFAILMVAMCLSPSSALPDLLAPFRSMFNKGGSTNSPYSKPPSSSASHHVNKHFGGPSSSPQDDDPFNSNFGFGSPPSPQGGQGGGGPSSSPYRGGKGYKGPSSSPFPSSGGPGIRGNAFSSSSSSSSSSSRPSRPSYNSRPVRQQPSGYKPGFPSSSLGSGGRPSPSPFRQNGGPSSHFGQNGGPPSYNSNSQKDHFPRPQGPPSGGQGNEDDSGPYKYQDGPGGPSGPSSPFSDGPSSYQGGPPSGVRGPFPGGPPSSSLYRGRPSGGPGGSYYDGPPSSSSSNGGEEEGPGFTGFGAFPGGDESDDSPSQGPPEEFSGYSGSKPFQSTRPSIESSSSPSQDGPGYQGQDGGPPSSSFFGGPPTDYTEQYEGGARGTRQPQSSPHIIGGNNANKYLPQINEDEEQGPPQGQGFGFGNSPFRSGPGGPGGQQESSPYNGDEIEEGPSPASSSPIYQPRPRQRPRYPASVGAFSNQGTGRRGYQRQGSDNVQYGKPMMASGSTNEPRVKVPRRQRKRYSAKISGPLPMQTSQMPINQNQGPIVPLISPKDPNFQEASSLNPVSAPFEPDTAASGHGGHEGGGHEGLSPNGDRILYHVSGHHGPHSYRFGYDTGKGYNRLFRFEEKDGKGYVKGKYGFYDKSGKLQVINYEAHPKHGFHAERAQSHKY